MQKEKRAGPPRTVYLLKRAETGVRSGLEACLGPLKVTPRQYVTLSLLQDADNHSSAELARKAGITAQSMSETIATLIAKGFIERSEHPGHRRILMTRLTAAGEALLVECEIAVDAMEARLLGDVSASDLDVLRAALGVIISTANNEKGPR